MILLFFKKKTCFIFSGQGTSPGSWPGSQRNLQLETKVLNPDCASATGQREVLHFASRHVIDATEGD